MKLKMKNILRLFLLSDLLMAGGLEAQETPILVNQKQPNIIFILTDDLGYGDIGVFNQNIRRDNNDRSEPWAVTPNLDKLASSGVTLMSHYASAPVSVSSRSSFLTGLHQGHANVRNNQFDKALEDNYTIGNVLQKAGYTTAAIGKWGLQGDTRWDIDGDLWPATPNKRGFDYFYGYMRHEDGHEHYPKEGLYRGAKEVYENNLEISNDLDKCYTTDLWTAATKKFIIDHVNEKGIDKPFFIYLAYDTPHAVLEYPTQAYPAGGGLKGGIQWIGQSGNMINTASGEIDSWVHPDYSNTTYDHDNNPSTAEVPWPETYKRFATSTRRIDDGVGDLMQLLEDLKIESNTIVVFTSDNGPSLESYLPERYVPYSPEFFNSFGPFDGVKRDCWEGGIRVPAIVSWPGKIGVRTVSKPNAMYDWFATFCDAAGYPAPARIDGVSLLPTLTGKGEQEKGLIYIEYDQSGTTPNFEEFAPEHRGRRRNQMQVIRFNDYLGVRYDITNHSDNFEIYNIEKDPKEVNNLADKPEMKTLQQQMKDRVLQVRMRDSTAKRPYDNELIPSVKINNLSSGIEFNTYEGNFPWIPQIKELHVSSHGKIKNVSPERADFKKEGIIYFQGYIDIPKDGEYTFFISTDNNAVLRIHDIKVIDADYGYKKGSEQKGTLLLKAGLHPFKLFYKNLSTDDHSFNFKWQGFEINKQEVPDKHLFN